MICSKNDSESEFHVMEKSHVMDIKIHGNKEKSPVFIPVGLQNLGNSCYRFGDAMYLPYIMSDQFMVEKLS